MNHIPSLVASLFAALTLASIARAGGSVDYSDIEPLLKDKPHFSHIIDSIKLNQTGSATRLGRHYGSVSGARVGPYEFKASGSDSPADLTIIIHTLWHLEDNNGSTIKGDPPEPPQDNRDYEIRETITKIEIIDNAAATTSDPDNQRRQPSKIDPAPPRRNTSDSATGNSSSMHPGPAPANTTATLSGTFAEGDYHYASEYFCDNYQVKLKAGQTLIATLTSSDVIPEIMSKKNQWFGSNGPRHNAKKPGEPATITYSADAESSLILLITNKNKNTPGAYHLAITLDGQPLAAPNPLPAPQTDKRIIPLN